MVDLQCRVLELEALLEQVLKPASRLVTVDAGRDEHVRGEGGKPTRDGPDVQVVDLGDVGIVDERTRAIFCALTP